MSKNIFCVDKRTKFFKNLVSSLDIHPDSLENLLHQIDRKGMSAKQLEAKIKEAIKCGISKININTDLQIAWSNAVRKFLSEDEKVYDPRKVIGSGEQAMKQRIKEIVTLFDTKL